MNDKAQITQLKEDLSRALREKDVAGTIAVFADESVMFVLNPPLQLKTGLNAPGESGIEAWFATFRGGIGIESRELEIAVGGDVAFAHCIERMSGTRTDGTITAMWYRETLGLRKTGGEWKITHQHQSVPMYMDGSGKAATDLKPEV